MSLKTFHIVFIALSTLLALVFGVWAVYTGLAQSRSAMIGLGLASFGVSVGLVLYGISFLKKLRRAGIV